MRSPWLLVLLLILGFSFSFSVGIIESNKLSNYQFFSQANDFTLRFTKTSCNASEMSITKPFCYIKAISRSYTTLNFGFNTTRNLDNFLLKHNLDYQYGTIFRRVLDPKPLDWCNFMEGNRDNIFIKVSLGLVEQSIPHLIHPFPYKGQISAFNLSIETGKFGAVYPRGKYRCFWKVTDDYDSNIITLTYDLEIKSPITTSFG